MLFSLAANFKYVITNGICCWGPDFAAKESPLIRYLALRSILVIMFIKDSFQLSYVLKYFWTVLAENLVSYHYGRAQSVVLAMLHVISGPSVFTANMDMKEVMAEIARFGKGEKKQLIAGDQRIMPQRHSPEHWFRRWFRLLSLNGYLFPAWALRKKPLVQRDGYSAYFPDSFLHLHIQYVDEASGLGYRVTRDVILCIRIAIRALRATVSLCFKFRSLCRTYQSALPQLSNEAFWRKIYAE